MHVVDMPAGADPARREKWTRLKREEEQAVAEALDEARHVARAIRDGWLGRFRDQAVESLSMRLNRLDVIRKQIEALVDAPSAPLFDELETHGCTRCRPRCDPSIADLADSRWDARLHDPGCPSARARAVIARAEGR